MKYSDIIKDYRSIWGLTQGEFACLLDVDPRSIQRWEHGTIPHPRYRQKLAPYEKAGEEQMKRRDFFRHFFKAGLTTIALPNLLESMESLSSTKAPLFFREELSAAETLTKACWQLLPHVSNRVDLRSFDWVHRHRRFLEVWGDRSPNDRIRSQLKEAIAEILLVEAILLYTHGHSQAAETVYQKAISMIKQTGNQLLGAIALAWFGNFLIDTGRANQSIEYLESARTKAKHSEASLTVRAWIEASVGDAWGRQRERYKCEVALGKAEAYTHSRGVESEPYPIPYDLAWFYGYKGSCYVRIDRLSEAQAVLQQGLQLLEPGTHRQASLYKDCIIAHGLQQEVEAACASARLALQIAEKTKAPMEFWEAHEAMKMFLKRWKDSPIVRCLAEEFQAVQQELGHA